MKLSFAFTFHYMIFLGVAILLSPVRSIRSHEKVDEIKIEKKQLRASEEGDNQTEILHSEILFKY